MRLVVSEFASLDGVMEEPRWTFEYHSRHPWTEDQLKFKNGELFESDALLLGRVTYQGFAAAWPSQQDDPQGYGKRINTMPKYVVSNTLDKLEWSNSRPIRGDLVGEITKLKSEPGKDLLVFGSLKLSSELLERRLVDELRLMVYPVFLGGGRRLFTKASALKPKLAEAIGFASGVVLLRYTFED
jgi:dihydrofolate reductase